MIIGGAALLVITLLIIILISVNKEKDNIREIGSIYCQYDIVPLKIETKILGDEFNKNSEFDIFVN